MRKKPNAEFFCFNSQPPEGGWVPPIRIAQPTAGFNSQPPEGGWLSRSRLLRRGSVSTHSRPKAAGIDFDASHINLNSFNSQPPEGGWGLSYIQAAHVACFNSQPPEGGWPTIQADLRILNQFQLTAARRRLGMRWWLRGRLKQFQLTAARRRLAGG